MKKRFLKIVIGIVFVCVLFVGFLYANNDIGMTSTNLEADIRSSQKIKDDWTLEGSVSNTMAAYISYPQDMSDHTFSVYVNRPGLSFGYFFRGGGTLSGDVYKRQIMENIEYDALTQDPKMDKERLDEIVAVSYTHLSKTCAWGRIFISCGVITLTISPLFK